MEGLKVLGGKKIGMAISVILSMVLLLGTQVSAVGVSTVFNGSYTTLFSDDFDTDYTVGDAPDYTANDKGPTNWSAYSTTDCNISVQYETGTSGNQVIKLLTNVSGANPKLDKVLDLSGNQKITIDFKVKTQGRSFSVDLEETATIKKTLFSCYSSYLNSPSSGSGTPLITIGSAGTGYVNGSYWMDISLMVDLENNRFTTVLNGQTIMKDGVLFGTVTSPNPQTDFSNIKIRFISGAAANQYLFLDDVSIRTTGNVVQVKDGQLYNGPFSNMFTLFTQKALVLTDGEKYVQKSVVNEAEEDLPVTFIVATYKAGVLTSVQTESVTVLPRESKLFMKSFTSSSATNDTVKIFLWDGINSMDPIDNSKAYTR